MELSTGEKVLLTDVVEEKIEKLRKEKELIQQQQLDVSDFYKIDRQIAELEMIFIKLCR